MTQPSQHTATLLAVVVFLTLTRCYKDLVILGLNKINGLEILPYSTAKMANAIIMGNIVYFIILFLQGK